jgi:hypothetical protein
MAEPEDKNIRRTAKTIEAAFKKMNEEPIPDWT